MNSRNGKSKKVESRPVSKAPAWQPIVRPLVGAVMVIFCITILSNSMIKEVGRDEQMYCTAGVLLAKGQMIYGDFSYPSQLPYHPLLLSILYRFLGTTHYLLVGRLPGKPRTSPRWTACTSTPLTFAATRLPGPALSTRLR